jgi:hypothetical protein
MIPNSTLWATSRRCSVSAPPKATFEKLPMSQAKKKNP